MSTYSHPKRTPSSNTNEGARLKKQLAEKQTIKRSPTGKDALFVFGKFSALPKRANSKYQGKVGVATDERNLEAQTKFRRRQKRRRKQKRKREKKKKKK